MFQIYLPLIVGLAVGLPFPGTSPDRTERPLQETTDPPVLSADPVAREAEPQIPTGRFTTAVEVRPILDMTRQNWVAVRQFEGKDLVYFTHLLAWRCGLWEIRYSLNGDPALQSLPMEPCHEDAAQPNALTEGAAHAPFITLPPDSVQSIRVELVFDDGTTAVADFSRQDVLMP